MPGPEPPSRRVNCAIPTPGNIVTARSDVVYVVTEFGIINLKGKSELPYSRGSMGLLRCKFVMSKRCEAYADRARSRIRVFQLNWLMTLVCPTTRRTAGMHSSVVEECWCAFLFCRSFSRLSPRSVDKRRISLPFSRFGHHCEVMFPNGFQRTNAPSI
jgi:hypothetical protein